jgi:hypothetical protein|tara:strand:+ start:2079 stop:3854 length:1776 start_codon:yes stop_codon:yes gene_type:complete
MSKNCNECGKSTRNGYTYSQDACGCKSEEVQKGLTLSKDYQLLEASCGDDLDKVVGLIQDVLIVINNNINNITNNITNTTNTNVSCTELINCLDDINLSAVDTGCLPEPNDKTLQNILQTIINWINSNIFEYDTDDFVLTPEECITKISINSDNIVTTVINNLITNETFITQVTSKVSIYVGNTIFVSKLGDDATGAREDRTKQYITLNAAIAGAVSGDTIIVSNGTYTETNTNINAINNTLTSINIVLEDKVILNTFIQCSNKDLSIVGKNSILDGGSDPALHFTGSGTKNLFLDLFKVTSSVGASAIYIDSVNSADLNIHYLFNLKPNSSGGTPLTLAVSDIASLSYKGHQNYIASNSSAGSNMDLSGISTINVDLDKLYSSVNSGGISIAASGLNVNDCFINIKNALIGQGGIKVSNANVVFDIEKITIVSEAESGIELRGSSSAVRTNVTIKDCEISGNIGGVSQTTSSNSLILIGGTGGDYVDLKIKNCTLSNISAGVNAGCIAVKGVCGVDSNAVIFSQNSHYFTNGTHPFEALYYSFGTCYYTNNVEVQLIGSTTSNLDLALAGAYYNFNTVALVVIDASFTKF